MRAHEELKPLLEHGQGSLRVLLIEDEEDVARAIMRGLARAGLSTAWANRGAAGLALKASLRPHVILMDLDLPDMDGRSLLSVLGHPRDCGVVVLSGMIDEAEHVMGGAFGVDDFVAKPPNMRDLVARIRAVHQRVNIRGEWEQDALSGGVGVEA